MVANGVTHILTGTGTMSGSGFGSSQLDLLINLSNASTIQGQGGERLTQFGFGVEPRRNFCPCSATLVTQQGSIGAYSSNFPNFQAVEVCATGGNNCAGGGNGGIFGGTSDEFHILLGGNSGLLSDHRPACL